MKIKTFRGGYDSNFTYVLSDENKCVIIDPAVPAKEILTYLQEHNLEPQFVVIMHSHFDHIVDLKIYKEHNIPIYAHESYKGDVDKTLNDGCQLPFNLKVFHTPGHRFDCICLFDGKNLFTSDTLFVEGCGRVDFEGSDPHVMVQTLNKLKELADDVIIYPGHDYGLTPTSTIGKEKKNNPYLKESEKYLLRFTN